MTFKTLDNLTDIAGKRVLVRVDLNVPVKDGKVTDATRIERVAPTIRELSEKGAKVVLLAHFGRPKGEVVADMSLEQILPAVNHVLGTTVGFAADCIGEPAAAAIAAMGNGDIYVNDAFSAAHRAHSSNFAADQTKVLDGNLVRILSWYDNEWGFSNRMSDTAVAMGKLI